MLKLPETPKGNMLKRPLVSVILPTYNRANLLSRAVNSVLDQTYQNFELIIVDGGSADNTGEVAKSFDDMRITYYKQEKNKGVLATRNTGFDLAKGDYVTFLDDDDELLPKALEVSVNKLSELSSKGIKIVWFDRIDAEQKKVSGFGIKSEGLIPYEDFLCDRIHGDFWMVMDRGIIGDDRFDERLWGNESILWLKLHRKSNAFYVPKILYKNYREHGERMCDFRSELKHISRVALTKKAFLEEYGGEIKSLCPESYGKKLAGVGFWLILNGRKVEGRETLLEALKFNFSLKHYILLLLSFILNKNQIASVYAMFLDMKKRGRKRLDSKKSEHDRKPLKPM